MSLYNEEGALKVEVVETVSSGGGAVTATGNVAHDAVDSGAPVKTGGIANSTAPTVVAVGDRVNKWLALSGASMIGLVSGAIGDAYSNSAVGQYPNAAGTAFVPSYTTNAVFNGTNWDRQRGDTVAISALRGLTSTYWTYAAAAGGIVSSTADVVLKTAAGANVRNYLGSLMLSHDLLGAATEFVIKDGATIIFRGKLQTAATDMSNGSGPIKFDPPLRGTANTALNFALLTSTTGGVFVNAQGFTGA